MCGRFVSHCSLSLIEKTFNVDEVACAVSPNYNIAPTQEVLVVRRNHQTRLDKFHWGLVPFWAKDTSIGSRLINARAETVAQKPSFRNAFENRRCLIVADGFYEWKGPKGQKQPWYLTLPSEEPFAFAGLWERWTGDPKGEYLSCVIITTAASRSVQKIHNRMPVILHPRTHDAWLQAASQDPAALIAILQEGQIRELISYPVSKRVNNVHNNDAECIQPLEISPS
ncbi:MAG: SOS response-associated peptidase [Desulfobacterales bacterium]